MTQFFLKGLQTNYNWKRLIELFLRQKHISEVGCISLAMHRYIPSIWRLPGVRVRDGVFIWVAEVFLCRNDLRNSLLWQEAPSHLQAGRPAEPPGSAAVHQSTQRSAGPSCWSSVTGGWDQPRGRGADGRSWLLHPRRLSSRGTRRAWGETQKRRFVSLTAFEQHLCENTNRCPALQPCSSSAGGSCQSDHLDHSHRSLASGSVQRENARLEGLEEYKEVIEMFSDQITLELTLLLGNILQTYFKDLSSTEHARSRLHAESVLTVPPVAPSITYSNTGYIHVDTNVGNQGLIRINTSTGSVWSDSARIVQQQRARRAHGGGAALIQLSCWELWELNDSMVQSQEAPSYLDEFEKSWRKPEFSDPWTKLKINNLNEKLWVCWIIDSTAEVL